MKQRIVLYAESGKVLTNGTTYGTIIYLADGVSPYSYWEITQEEYERILAEQEEQNKEI
jgi:hypothetical protein